MEIITFVWSWNEEIRVGFKNISEVKRNGGGREWNKEHHFFSLTHFFLLVTSIGKKGKRCACLDGNTMDLNFTRTAIPSLLFFQQPDVIKM